MFNNVVLLKKTCKRINIIVQCPAFSLVFKIKEKGNAQIIKFLYQLYNALCICQ